MHVFSKAREGGLHTPLNLPAAATFRPTTEEFQDPLRYIASIRAIAEPYGLAKIVPPEGWSPPCVINKDTFKFPTRVQSVHELQDRSQNIHVQQAFLSDYETFLASRGRSFKGNPSFGDREIDLYKLFKVVEKRGGHKAVTNEKQWNEVCRVLQVQNVAGVRF
jgi:[histone H3]-trimethyl-L-lysine4 demethylase